MTLTIDPDLATQLRPNLSKDEKLLWTGQPKTGILFRSTDVFIIPFSLMWGGFAIFWELSVIRTRILLFELWGIPFVLVGLFMIVGRFFYDAKKRGNTIYGITDDRIIIKSGAFSSSSIQSLNIKTLTGFSFREKTDGTGTILLGPSNQFSMLNGSGWPARGQQAPRLEFIPEARKVYELIVSLQRQN